MAAAESARARQAALVGRDAELAAVETFLDGETAARAFVLHGEAGIGKTTVWHSGLELADERGLRVLRARSSDAEAQYAFAALIDLLDEVEPEAFDSLPAPQRKALDVVLLRSEPAEAPPEPRAIAVGLLGVVRELGAETQLLVAVDDAQWLDVASADAIAFAARRLDAAHARFLLTKRGRGDCALEAAFTPGEIERCDLGPLSVGATRRLLSQHLGLALPRPQLRRIVEVTLGNPLFALEIGRALATGVLPAAGAEIPVPEAVEDLLGMRVDRLSAPARKTLLAVALSADLPTKEAAELAGVTAVDEAVGAGVVAVDGDRLRPAHPLLAAAARQRTPEPERMATHRELAEVVADTEVRARHLALGTEAPDDTLAATIAEAAAKAAARGAPQEAVELAEQALRLTPPESPRRPERLLALGAHLEATGALERMTAVLAPQLETLPPGRPRVEALVMLSDGGDVHALADSLAYLERALAESGDDEALRALVIGKLAGDVAAIAVERLAEMERRALEALPAARTAGSAVLRLVLEAIAWARALRGGAIDDLCADFHAASAVPASITASPDRIAGQRLVWRGEIEEARAMLTPLLAEADERGEAVSFALARLHMCELELRVGRWDEAGRLLDSWAETPDDRLLFWPMYERCRALHEAGIGRPDAAERWATKAIATAEAKGVGWDRLEALRARGIAALLAHEPERAAEPLRAAWAHTVRKGVDEPGVFPVAPDLVEALVELGELEQAEEVTSRLRELAERQEHPWGLATTRRCAGLLRLSEKASFDAGAAELEEAADAYARLGLALDRARTLRTLGRAARKARKWGVARDSLERSAAAFAELGSTGWAEEVRAELQRVGARKPQGEGELTDAERRVVDLAAAGRSNKEIAATLFVSVHTVEIHLSHAYAKLGIRSRSQLAQALAARNAKV